MRHLAKLQGFRPGSSSEVRRLPMLKVWALEALSLCMESEGQSCILMMVGHPVKIMQLWVKLKRDVA